jgi:IclR-like helix-turn-helix domain-containing protein
LSVKVLVADHLPRAGPPRQALRVRGWGARRSTSNFALQNRKSEYYIARNQFPSVSDEPGRPFARSLPGQVHCPFLRTVDRISLAREALPLKEIAARSGQPKTITFRLLYTLEKCGMIDKVGENLYLPEILQGRRAFVAFRASRPTPSPSHQPRGN